METITLTQYEINVLLNNGLRNHELIVKTDKNTKIKIKVVR